MGAVGPLKLSELSTHLEANGMPNALRGDPDLMVTGCNTIESAGDGEITFLANPKYRDRIGGSRATAIIIREDDASAAPSAMAQIICDDPYRALMLAVIRVHGFRSHPQWGRHEQAYVAESAKIGRNANLAPGVTICEDVIIGDNVTLYPGVFVGPAVVLGNDVLLYPNVTVYDRCRLGDRVTIHAGTVIGEDGLGYAPVGDKWLKIPQAGAVIIEDDVEIGANCSIDRATLGMTRLGAGTKFSNAVTIGHGCQIGADCMFVAQVGLAGSVTVGRHVTIAGQAGVVGHLNIGDDAQICAQSGVNNSVEPGAKVLGAPAVPVKEARRQYAAVQKLPELRNRVRELERELAALRDQIETRNG